MACNSLPLHSPSSFSPRPVTLALVLCAALGSPWAVLVPQAAQAQQGAQPVEVRFAVKRYEIVGDNPLGDARAQEILRPYLGEQTGLDGIQNAARALERALSDAGYGLYRVTVPPQETVDVIRLQISRFPITSIHVEGAKYFGEANVRASVPDLQIRETPNMREVARQLTLANENPSKRTTLRLREDGEGDGIAATLETQDSNPLSFAVGLNNSGSRDTGRSRITGYLQHANLFNRDHVLGVSYTTSPESGDDVEQYGLAYRIPIYSWGGMVSFSHAYSSVDSGALGSGFTITGKGRVSVLDYTHYFRPDGPYKSWLTVAIADKLFEAAEINSIPLTEDVRSRPLSLTYVGRYEPDWGVMLYNVEYAVNMKGGSHNTQAAYAANRFGADNDWDVLRAGLSLSVPLGKKGWQLNTGVRGQYADEPLIGGEQFGVGGAASVRGAEERAVTGDSGMSGTIEVWTPQVARNLRLLGFFDSGTVKRRMATPGTTARETLSSVGLGLRWALDRKAAFSLDYGYITDGTSFPDIESGDTRWHASFLYRF